jgi:hypothetical protein
MDYIHAIDAKEVALSVQKNGFTICKNIVPVSYIKAQKKFWIQKFKICNVNKKFVRGNLVLGESNFLSYSDIPAWCMYRNFDFLWNEGLNEEYLKIHLSLHSIRNQIQGYTSSFGLEYNPLSYGIYLSTSLYEANKGHLAFHADGHGDIPILHYMLPITFKGEDYTEGGLFCYDKDGLEHDIDKMVSPGDLIFFDGRMRHGVKKIISESELQIGRIAQFAVPTHFEKDARLSVFRRSMTINLLEIANKLKLVKLS